MLKKINLLLLINLILCSFDIFASELLIPPPPKLAAKSYILQDYYSGDIIAAYKPNMRVEPASLTKMMTSYVISKEIRDGRLNPNSKVLISRKARNAQGSRMFVEYNTYVSVKNLIHGVIIQSGNDAAIALAEYIAGTEQSFVEIMNMEAQRLQMNDTHFANATGLPAPNHYSTAHDLATLSKAIITDFPEDYALYSQKWYSYNNIKQFNRNQLLWRPSAHVDGIKTGHTDSAGYCLAASAVDNGTRLVAVMVGTKSEEARSTLTQTLLHYGFRFFKTYTLFDKDKKLAEHNIQYSDGTKLDLGLKENIKITIPKGEYKNLQAKILVPKNIDAPIKAGSSIGKITVTLNDKVVAEKPLVALNNVNKGTMWQRFKDYAMIMFSSKINKKDNSQMKEIAANI